MFTKYATCEGILEVKTSSNRLDYSPNPGEMLQRFAKVENEDTEDGYVYVRTRAISSRVNKNNDGWPSAELAKGYKTFIGRPIFVDHNNNDPRRTRGVIVDAVLHVDSDKTSALDPYYSSAPENHRPPTWVELLMEVDGKTFPKLAKDLKSGKIDSTSMGANIERSICSVCANEATVPSEYCDHIRSKGNTFEVTADNGERIKKKAYEDCLGVNFFEDSFVFDPADETALNLDVSDVMPITNVTSKTAKNSKVAVALTLDSAGRIGFSEASKLKNMSPAQITLPPNSKFPEGLTVTGQNPQEVMPYSFSHFDEHGMTAPITVNVEGLTPEEIQHVWPTGKISKTATLDPGGDPNYLLNDDQGGYTEYSKTAEAQLPPLDEQQKAELTQEIQAAESGEQPHPQGILGQLMTAFNSSYRGETAVVGGALALIAAHYGIPHFGSRWAHLISKVAAPPNVNNDRKLNTVPQSDETKAPQKVDTLRSDIECPNCEADILQVDPDGIQRCETCGYEQPPEGLDNPDLSKARELDKDEILNGPGEENAEGDVVQATDEDANDDKAFIEPLGPSKDMTPRSSSIAGLFVPQYFATNSYVPTRIISEMWKTRIATNSIEEANQALKQTIAGAVQTQIEYHGGIHFVTQAKLASSGLQGTVTYPGAPGPLPLGAGANQMQHFMYQVKAVKEQGLQNPGELTVTVEAPDDQLDQVLHIIHTGGEGAEAPAAPVASTKTSDRRVIKREETPEGHKTEQIVEETGGLDNLLEDKPKEEEAEPEEKEEPEEGKSDSKPNFLQKEQDDPHKKLLAALAVAEEAVDMGIISKEKKLAFVGQLENESLDQIESRKQTLVLVKSAGLQKALPTRRIASALPRVNSGGSLNGSKVTNLDDIPFQAVFLN